MRMARYEIGVMYKRFTTMYLYRTPIYGEGDTNPQLSRHAFDRPSTTIAPHRPRALTHIGFSTVFQVCSQWSPAGV